MLPRLSRINFFDDMLDDTLFKKESNLMKTDIKESDTDYTLEIDVPGCKKENIKIDLESGYLNVNVEILKDTTEENENYIHRERFSGSCSRSYYVGDNITEEDINANFKNGILKITVPKKEDIRETSKKFIDIQD